MLQGLFFEKFWIREFIFKILIRSMVLSSLLARLVHGEAADYFGIHVVDSETGRGVPLITLTTVNHQAWVSDSAGWIAFQEPGLMDTEVFFHVKGPGYSVAKDGFGYAGIRFKPQAGKTTTLKVNRDNIAERLYRITGQGVYRDSLLLGQPIPGSEMLKETSAVVLGQDSVQAVPWRGKVFWLWGDTNIARYPLGNFRTTCAWSDFPDRGGLLPQHGVALDYFRQKDGQLRRMMPSEAPGAIWIFGLLTVTDLTQHEHLLGHYGRFESLTNRVEHGIAEFDEAQKQFRSVRRLEKKAWQHPVGNAVQVQTPEGTYFYFTESLPVVRVLATYESVLDLTAYQAFTWSEEKQGYHWQREKPAMTQQREKELIQSGKVPADQARFQIHHAETLQPVQVHRACINWNAHRQSWIMIATEIGGGTSQLGEVWYAEAPAPEGPWGKAVKIASHPRYSFYNPRHHSFFDQDEGRFIYFEGTYTESFSGNPVPTPRYDYNQIMYRLDLDDPRLIPCHAEMK